MEMESVLSCLLSPLSSYLLLTLACFIIFLNQISYLKRKRLVPGPLLVPPFLGNALRVVADPAGFWAAQSALAKPLGFSANYIAGRFILFIRDSELSHKIFTNVRPDAFHLVGHPFGKKLFGDHNLIYMTGDEHKDLRRRIAPNFTPKALATYTASQQLIIRTHLEKWLRLSADAKPVPLRLLIRDMNLETSQKVFVGSYLSTDARERFDADYALFNVGLMALPVDLPGFAFWRARIAVDRLVETLAVCAERSKLKMENGEEATCLIDFWMQDTVEEMAAAKEAGEVAPPHSGDREIGGHLFDFLFAAQDASTSSLLWAVTLLDSHPEVLSKVREEVGKIWSPEKDNLITGEQLREMKYTEAVAREVIRYRAPATMVPHIAGEDFPLTDTYTIPKGTIVFPSVFESSFQGFTEPIRFDPDRFSENRHEDRTFKRNFMAFGAGPHQCVGQRYALNHLMLFIAIFTTLIDFKRLRTDGCDDLMYVPTICPKDDCTVFMKGRFVRSSFPNVS